MSARCAAARAKPRRRRTTRSRSPASSDAAKAGYTQVLYLDGVHRKYLDEVGTMNIMVRIGDEVITPPLAGTILDGVTRASALQLMRDWGLKVSERQVASTR
jgi:branched-chain amino acid aminotransferase